MLEIELVPSTCFYNNLRSLLTKNSWDVLRKNCYKQAGNVCEICGGVGNKWPVECHEIWEYDDRKQTQTLTGLTALCPRCHEVKHFGCAELRGVGDRAMAWLMQINGWGKGRAQEYVNKAFNVWERRCLHKWTQDLSWLDGKNVEFK